MVSGMESSFDPRQDLVDAERAAAAPYLDYPPTPAWFAPAVGLWAGALVAVLGLDSHALRLASIAVLIAVELLFLGWYRRKRGVMPRLRHAPPEIAREMRWYGVGVLVLVVVVVGTFLVSTLAAVVLTMLLVTAGLAAYERRYERAAAATRARLA